MIMMGDWDRKAAGIEEREDELHRMSTEVEKNGVLTTESVNRRKTIRGEEQRHQPLPPPPPLKIRLSK